MKITATHAEHSSEFIWTNPTGIFGDMKLIGDYVKALGRSATRVIVPEPGEKVVL